MAKAVSAAPRWPPGPMPWLILIVYTSSLAVAFIPTVRDLYGFAQLYSIGVKVLGSVQMMQKVMKAATLAHGLEALVTVGICSSAKLHLKHSLGWAGLTLLLGYGAILPLQRSIKAQRAEADGRQRPHKSS